MGSLGKTMLKGGSVTGAVQVLKLIIQIASIAVLGRLMTAEEFGIVGMVATFTLFMNQFRDFGLGAAIVQKETVVPRELTGVLQVSILIGVLLFIVSILAAPLLVALYGDERVAGVMRVAGISLMLSAPSVVAMGIMRRSMRFTSVALLELLGFSIGIGVSICVAYAGWGYWSPIVGNLVSAFVILVACWIALGSGQRPMLFVRGCLKDAWSLLKRGGSLSLVELLNYLGHNLDRILIGRFIGPAALGHYTRAYSLSIMPAAQVLGPIGAVVVPSLSRLRGDKVKYNKFFSRMFNVTLLVSIPVSAILIVMSQDLFLLIMGEGWNVAAQIAVWLGVIMFSKPCSSVIYWMFLTSNQNRTLIQWSCWNAGINIMTFILSIKFGVIALSASYALVGLLVRTPLAISYASKLGGTNTRHIFTTYFVNMAKLAVMVALLFLVKMSLTEYSYLMQMIGVGFVVIILMGMGLFLSEDGRWLIANMRHYWAAKFPRK